MLELLTCLCCIASFGGDASKMRATDRAAIAQVRGENEQLRLAHEDPDGIVKTAARLPTKG